MALILTCDACDRIVSTEERMIQRRIMLSQEPKEVVDLYAKPGLIGFCPDCMQAFEEWCAARKGTLRWTAPTRTI